MPALVVAGSTVSPPADHTQQEGTPTTASSSSALKRTSTMYGICSGSSHPVCSRHASRISASSAAVLQPGLMPARSAGLSMQPQGVCCTFKLLLLFSVILSMACMRHMMQGRKGWEPLPLRKINLGHKPIPTEGYVKMGHLQSGRMVQYICMPQSLAFSAASFAEGVDADGRHVSAASRLVTDSGRNRETPACILSRMLVLCIYVSQQQSPDHMALRKVCTHSCVL